MAGSSNRGVPEIVIEEAKILDSVKKAITSAPRPAWLDHQDRDLVALRDALAEEKLVDDRASLLEEMDRISRLSEIRERYAPDQVNPHSPYFGRLLLHYDDGRKSNILIGSRSFFRDGVRIVDWRRAPISGIFYRYREGERFDEDIAGRRVTGRVVHRRTVTIVGGRLVRVSNGSRVYLRDGRRWREVHGRGTSLAGGAGTASRPENTTPGLGVGMPVEAAFLPVDRRLAAISPLLDAEQFELLTSEPEQLLVITGGAGSGKTTVGLHRIAWLHYQDPRRFRTRRMLVLVFGRALERYIGRVLPALGVDDVPVRTMTSWALGQMHKHFGDISRRLVDSTPAVVVRCKTHGAMIPMLEEAAAAASGADPLELFDDLFTNREWLRQGLQRHAPGEFSPDDVAAIHRWCTRLQFARADGEARDEIPAGYDEDDPIILLRLYQLLRGPLRYSHGRRLGYDHLMVDEAQDFSPLELRVLLELVRGQSVTLAGDPAQKLTPNDLGSWQDVLQVLPVSRHEVASLKVSYRSTRPITEFAQEVLGPLAAPPPPQATRDGPPVELFRFAAAGPAFTFLADALLDLQRREAQATVAVLAPDRAGAEQAWRTLRKSPLSGLNHVTDQDFSFAPGIEVCDVAQAKGLEFDYVVLVGVDRDNYPATPSSRHLLHVGATRAVHQLWLLSWGPPCALLPGGLKARLAG